MRHIRTDTIFLLLLARCVFAAAQAKDMSNVERDQVESMLSQVSSDLVHHYYDPKLHGVDWQAKVRLAREQVKQEREELSDE